MYKQKISILGAGSWGTALAIHLARKGYAVHLWSHRPGLAEEIATTGKNSSYLPGAAIPGNVSAGSDLEEAVSWSGVVISAVPSHAFREVALQALRWTGPGTVFINAAKGIEENTLLRLSQVYHELSGRNKFVVLSGPSHAEEVVVGMPTAVVVASLDGDSAALAQNVLMSPEFRVYTNQDVTGVELGGALKNIIALGTGIADGLGYGDNTKAALMTRGLAEIARLGVAMGASPLTFAGLAGVGDLIVTCTSMHSRNRRAGIEIGKGKSPGEALASVRMVVEGVKTTRAAWKLSLQHNVEMPISEQMYMVLFEEKDPRKAVSLLMGRGKKDELEDIGIRDMIP